MSDIITQMHPDGFYIIRPRQLDVIPLECPVCIRMMSDADDAAAYRKYACCHDCMLTWAEPNRDAWLAGWRPLFDDVDARHVDVKSRIIDRFLVD